MMEVVFLQFSPVQKISVLSIRLDVKTFLTAGLSSISPLFQSKTWGAAWLRVGEVNVCTYMKRLFSALLIPLMLFVALSNPLSRGKGVREGGGLSIWLSSELAELLWSL